MLKDVIENQAAAWGALGAPAILERFCLRNGIEMRGAKRPRHVRKMRDRECFKNAADVSLKRGLVYMEGYAMTDQLGIPVHHAWCFLEGYGVIDPTWRDPECAWYLGVKIDARTLARQLFKNRFYGLLDTGAGLDVAFMTEIDPGMAALVEQALAGRCSK